MKPIIVLALSLALAALGHAGQPPLALHGHAFAVGASSAYGLDLGLEKAFKGATRPTTKMQRRFAKVILTLATVAIHESIRAKVESDSFRPEYLFTGTVGAMTTFTLRF